MKWSDIGDEAKKGWKKAVEASADLGKKTGSAATDAWKASEPKRRAATEQIGKVASASWDGAKKAGAKTTDLGKQTWKGARWAGDQATAQAAALAAFLSQAELLKWSESITEGAASVYDKAMDATFLRTHVGGGNHRMFDGGHTLSGAWDRVADASSTDSFSQEVIGYVSSIWKDITTAKGLPFVTWEKDDYDRWTDWAAEHIPGVDKEFLYDLLSFDAFEVLAAGLGSVAVIFALSSEDKRKLSEILGSMGIISIISANPIMGLAVIATTAYAYFVKKRELDGKALLAGGIVGGVSLTIFAVLGLPLLVELVIAMVVTALLKKYVLSRDDLMEMVGAQAKAAQMSASKLVSSILGELGLSRG